MSNNVRSQLLNSWMLNIFTADHVETRRGLEIICNTVIRLEITDKRCIKLKTWKSDWWKILEYGYRWRTYIDQWKQRTFSVCLFGCFQVTHSEIPAMWAKKREVLLRASRGEGHPSPGKYRKIPKISRRAYIFQRPFLRGLFLKGLI